MKRNISVDSTAKKNGDDYTSIEFMRKIEKNNPKKNYIVMYIFNLGKYKLIL